MATLSHTNVCIHDHYGEKVDALYPGIEIKLRSTTRRRVRLIGARIHSNMRAAPHSRCERPFVVLLCNHLHKNQSQHSIKCTLIPSAYHDDACNSRAARRLCAHASSAPPVLLPSAADILMPSDWRHTHSRASARAIAHKHTRVCDREQ